jgi:hypothetical protein
MTDYRVDPEYADEIACYKWSLTRGYLRWTGGPKGSRTHTQMHQLVWRLAHGRDLPDGLEVDHINGDKTDNRIANLRPATRRLNALNRSRRGWKKSGLPRGVYRSRTNPNRYEAILQGRRRTHIGWFDSAEEASRAYQKCLDEAVAMEAEIAMNMAEAHKCQTI